MLASILAVGCFDDLGPFYFCIHPRFSLLQSSNDWVFQILIPLSGALTIWADKFVRARLQDKRELSEETDTAPNE